MEVSGDQHQSGLTSVIEEMVISFFIGPTSRGKRIQMALDVFVVVVVVAVDVDVKHHYQIRISANNKVKFRPEVSYASSVSHNFRYTLKALCGLIYILAA